MSVKLLMTNKMIEDATFNVYIMDTTKTPNDLVVTLANDRGEDTTQWDGITDWGDGTRDTSLTHTYATDGQYEIKTKYKLDATDNYYNNTRNKLIKCKMINKNMTNLASMFKNCINLTFLDASKWDTSKVTKMNSMLKNCTNLVYLDVSNWDISSVTTIASIFSGCYKLITLDVSKWDTSSVTDMSYAFNACDGLTTLDVSKWNTSKVTKMNSMFRSTNLVYLNVSNWDTSSVINMNYMLSGCIDLTTLDISNWDISKVTNLNNMFNACNSLNELKLLVMTSENILKIIDNTTTGFPYHTPFVQGAYKLYISASTSVDKTDIQNNKGWTVLAA